MSVRWRTDSGSKLIIQSGNTNMWVISKIIHEDRMKNNVTISLGPEIVSFSYIEATSKLHQYFPFSRGFISEAKNNFVQTFVIIGFYIYNL